MNSPHQFIFDFGEFTYVIKRQFYSREKPIMRKNRYLQQQQRQQQHQQQLQGDSLSGKMIHKK